mgnify:CR=1 FL=1
MSSRSLNSVQLIGNVVADLILKYTASNDPVCSFSLATNRYWTTAKGEKKEDVEFHRLVAWGKLAELCNQLIKKGSKIYAEGRLSTRTFKIADGTEKTITEIVLEDMIILDGRPKTEPEKPVVSENKTP